MDLFKNGVRKLTEAEKRDSIQQLLNSLYDFEPFKSNYEKEEPSCPPKL
jgi:hypothetical protein